MISCLFCAVSLLYGYFVSKKLLLLFIALLMFLLAAGCHQNVVSKVKELEKKAHDLEILFQQQVNLSKTSWDVIQKAMKYKDLGGDDLK